MVNVGKQMAMYIEHLVKILIIHLRLDCINFVRKCFKLYFTGMQKS